MDGVCADARTSAITKAISAWQVQQIEAGYRATRGTPGVIGAGSGGAGCAATGDCVVTGSTPASSGMSGGSLPTTDPVDLTRLGTAGLCETGSGGWE
jgi:hypothetical protein